MKYLVMLKRKQTMNAVQNVREKRVEVVARSEADAAEFALSLNNHSRYYKVDSVRRA